MKIKAIGFDLDNTLYDQRDFEFPVFKIIAKVVGVKFSLNSEIFLANLINLYEKGERNRLFDKAIKETLNFIPPDWEEFVQKELLPIYRTYTPPRLQLYPEARELLWFIKSCGICIAIITNGRYEIQRKKIELLGISSLMDLILISDAFYPPLRKPDPRIFKFFLCFFNVNPKECIYIGDDENIDKSCEKVGIKFIKVGSRYDLKKINFIIRGEL